MLHTVLALGAIVVALSLPTLVHRALGWHLPPIGPLELAPAAEPELETMSLEEAIKEALEAAPKDDPAAPPPSFEELLGAAMHTLRELNHRFSRSPSTRFFLNAVEADLSYGISGHTQLVAHPAVRAKK